MTLSTPVLLGDVTVYVDSATGNDGNPGSQAAPFLTFARAWQERQRYGTLRAKFTIQLMGVGPYTMPARLGASTCDVGGYLIIRGDEASEVQHATGTFTGDFGSGSLGCTIGTSAGLGSDTHKNRFVKITSGPAAGCVFMILKHTDTSIVACNRRFKSAGSFTITAGTTFKVFTPGTQLTSTSTVIENWVGGELFPTSVDQRHLLLNLAVIGGLAIRNTTLALSVCTFTAACVWYLSAIATFWVDATILGAPNAHAYRASGIAGTSLSIAYYTTVYGPVSLSGSLNVFAHATLEQLGGRLGGTSAASQYGQIKSSASGTNEVAYRFEGTVTAQSGGLTNLGGSISILEWAVTVGSCLRAIRGGLVDWLATSNAPIGGTTDLAGYGIDCSGGGRVHLSIAPTLTGGTGGLDLKTTNLTAANSALAAAGDGISDPGLNECIVRVA